MIGGPRGMLEQEVSKLRNVGRTLGRLAGYFKPYWLVLAGVVLLMVVNAWVQVITPAMLGQAVDCYLTPAVTSEVATGIANAAAQDQTQAAVAAPTTKSDFSCWFGTVPAGAPKDAVTLTEHVRGRLGRAVTAGVAPRGQGNVITRNGDVGIDIGRTEQSEGLFKPGVDEFELVWVVPGSGGTRQTAVYHGLRRREVQQP